MVSSPLLFVPPGGGTAWHAPTPSTTVVYKASVYDAFGYWQLLYRSNRKPAGAGGSVPLSPPPLPEHSDSGPAPCELPY